MSKYTQMAAGRNEGMEFALRIVQKGGVEALEREIKNRGLTKIDARLTHEEINEASEKIKARIMDTVLAMSCMVLRDEFDFGNKRLNRFIGRFNEKTECLMGGYMDWADIVETLDEEVKIRLSITEND